MPPKLDGAAAGPGIGREHLGLRILRRPLATPRTLGITTVRRWFLPPGVCRIALPEQLDSYSKQKIEDRPMLACATCETSFTHSPITEDKPTSRARPFSAIIYSHPSFGGAAL